MSFKISDKVVCVDDAPGSLGRMFPELFPHRPKRGMVYVIREPYISVISKIPGVRLVGMVNGVNPFSREEVGFRTTRFRLLSEIQAENRIAREARHE